MGELYDKAEILENHVREYDDTFITAVNERLIPQRIRCETRDGEVVFVFDTGGDYKTVVKADVYLALLTRLHADPQPSHYGITNSEI